MRRRPDTPSDAASAYDGPSKSQLKRDMHGLQDLGMELLELTDAQLDNIEMDERLRDALRELRSLTSHEGRRRQAQYVGKLLRLADTGPFEIALNTLRDGKVRDNATLDKADFWRQKLMDDDAALDEWVSAYPAGNTRQIRALIQDARRDREAESLPGAVKGRRHAYRELFQKLRAVLLASGAA